MPKTAHRKSAPKVTKNAASPVATVRHALHMTQAQFAAAMGVSVTTISLWECGSVPTNRTAEKLMAIYAAHPELAKP